MKTKERGVLTGFVILNLEHNHNLTFSERFIRKDYVPSLDEVGHAGHECLRECGLGAGEVVREDS